MTDLKLMDELLCDLQQALDNRPWREMVRYSSTTSKAMKRLAEAYWSGEMKTITASLAMYFDNIKD